MRNIECASQLPSKKNSCTHIHTMKLPTSLPQSGTRHSRTAVQIIFDAGLVFKAIDGFLEILGGILLALVTTTQLNQWVRLLTQHELDSDADDVVVRFFIHSIQHRSASTQAFATVFLIGHGLAKAGLVYALMRQYRWAYPTATAIFGSFLLYQLYRFSLTHALWLLAMSIIDAFVIVLTLLEYRRRLTFQRRISRV